MSDLLQRHLEAGKIFRRRAENAGRREGLRVDPVGFSGGMRIASWD
ncbi:hypothetical protein [Methylopila turkensis]|nr:hypothetical protein [Methylopila turkensis]